MLWFLPCCYYDLDNITTSCCLSYTFDFVISLVMPIIWFDLLYAWPFSDRSNTKWICEMKGLFSLKVIKRWVVGSGGQQAKFSGKNKNKNKGTKIKWSKEHINYHVSVHYIQLSPSNSSHHSVFLAISHARSCVLFICL